MENKKIVFLTNSLAAGGAEKVISVLLSELVKQKYKIELICLEQNNFYEIPKEVKLTYLTNFNGKEKGIKKLLFIPILAWKLKKYIKNTEIIQIQSHVYRSNYINILAKIFGSKHNVQIVNTGTISKYYNEGLVGKINLFLIKFLYPKANLIITKSKGMLLDMQSLYNFKNEIIVLNNPYDIEKIKKLKNEIVDDFNFKSDKKYIISVGRFETFKQQDYIIETLTKLSNEYELILLGDGYKKNYLQALSNKLNVQDRVHFLGRVLNPYKYMAKSDLYILSSNNGEGFPNVLIEAMICNLPIISSDCKSGPREILAPETDTNIQIQSGIEEAKYGILVPIGNIKSLVNAIILMENNTIKNKYVSNAKKRMKDFEVNIIVDKYKKVLNVK